MRKTQLLFALATVASLSGSCMHSGSAAGDLGGDEYANTALLYTKNLSNEPIELRVLTSGQSRFVGSVQSGESNVIAIDPTLLPAGELYVVGVSPDGRRRAIAGPLAVSTHDAIRFRIEQDLSLSRATVGRR